MRPYQCSNGAVYLFPDKSCVFCDHCTDIFYDYTNGPYLMICELPGHYSPEGAGCKHFTESGDEHGKQ